jgi:hypothetical protein
MKDVVYKGVMLMRNSEAFMLWDLWQKAKSDRNKFQKKLDDHMKMLDQKEKDLLERYK